MRQYINITANEQVFPYLIEFSKGSERQDVGDNDTQYYVKHYKSNNTIKLFESDVEYYRNNNEWYNVNNIVGLSNEYIPISINTTKVKVYIPAHSISTYEKNVKYAVSMVTWINDFKIDLGSFIFNPCDALAIPSGPIKNGNNEYHEYVEFDIIDPFYLIYSDEWKNFRHIICGEPENINSIGPSLQLSLHVVQKTDSNDYTINGKCVGGYTNFVIASDNDYASLSISISNEPFGINFKLMFNEDYDWFLTYLRETYNIVASHRDIMYELILKSKNEAILGPHMTYTENVRYSQDRYEVNQIMEYDRHIKSAKDERQGINEFFKSWDAFEEGWSFVGSLVVLRDDIEIFNLVSNEIPVTQEIFSMFYADGTEKIIDINDMNITKYNVVNKIENRIVTLERPTESKANIIQPVFFRANETEMLTLHPLVNETISINCDDYKSKVSKFVLQIEGCKFEQIGSNKYGIMFRINANALPASAVSGTYYLLNEDLELITTGKYNCIR